VIREVRRFLHYAPGVARGADFPAFAGIAVSRSGITQMGLDVAQRVGLCAIGRATNQRFLCFSALERLVWEPHLFAQGEPINPSSSKVLS
jgi:hypothetical protein